jgi:hypothetical protein
MMGYITAVVPPVPDFPPVDGGIMGYIGVVVLVSPVPPVLTAPPILELPPFPLFGSLFVSPSVPPQLKGLSRSIPKTEVVSLFICHSLQVYNLGDERVESANPVPTEGARELARSEDVQYLEKLVGNIGFHFDPDHSTNLTVP